jgi:biopolymer transport protein ExbD
MITFARKHKIFRGQFQAGPFAAVFVLFLILIMFNTSFVYLPGLPVDVDAPGLALRPAQVRAVVIEDRGFFRYQRETLKDFEALNARLREDVRTNAALRLLMVQAGPAVTNEVVRRVVELARELKLAVDLPGGRIDLPQGASLVIATNQMISLAINMSGQFYFHSQVVPEDRLTAELADEVRKAGRPLTLLILADKTVEYRLITRAGDAARAAGIRQVLLALRPALFEEEPPL